MRVLFENKIDTKILKLMPPEYELVHLSFGKLLNELFNPKPKLLLFRYLRIGYAPIAIIRYTLLLLAAKLTGTPVIWFMHNLDEHKAKSYIANRIIRYGLWTISQRIFVFHDSILELVPARFHSKFNILTFGPISQEIFQKKHEDEVKFLEEYSNWIGYRKINLLIVSTAKRTSYPRYVRHLSKNRNILVINALADEDFEDERVLLFKGYVYGMLKEVIEQNERPMISLVFHDNTSVSTSIYLFSELKIPVITNDKIPNNKLVELNRLGKVISSEIECEQAIEEILNDFERYQDNCTAFTVRSNWENSQSILRTQIGQVMQNG